jgi:hypothetical protein
VEIPTEKPVATFEDLLLVLTLLKADVVSAVRVLDEVAQHLKVALDVPARFEAGRLEAIREALKRAECNDTALAEKLRGYLS